MADKKNLLVSFTESTNFLVEVEEEEEQVDMDIIDEETPLIFNGRENSINSDTTFSIEDIENRLSDLSDENPTSSEKGSSSADNSPQKSDDDGSRNRINSDDDPSLDPSLDPSFHLGNKRVSARNIMASPRRTSSFQDFGEVYEMVPTQLKDNVKLVTDINLYDHEQGKMYFAEYSLYKNSHIPKYALTVQSSIYRQIWDEVNEAYSVPCGLYFCCHGGDGAHTGVSHDDYVDIKLAWFILVLVFGALISVEVALPWPESYGVSDDTFSNPVEV
jgi:hypothetical protein